MKKSISKKLGIIALAGSVLMASCSPIIDESTDPQQVIPEEVLVVSESSGDLNARKSTEVAYYERFTNELFQIDESGNPTQSLPAYLPGTGVGSSSHMGKALTFINQYASGQNGLGTVGAPVNNIFGDKLAEIGIIIDNPEVSSVTTDGKGNSIWFKNKGNNVTPTSSPERFDFEAEVEIIGGTGKFEGATGSGTVTGYFNPSNGQGMSTIKGKMLF